MTDIFIQHRITPCNPVQEISAIYGDAAKQWHYNYESEVGYRTQFGRFAAAVLYLVSLPDVPDHRLTLAGIRHRVLQQYSVSVTEADVLGAAKFLSVKVSRT